VQEFQSLYQENLGPVYRYVYSKVRNREEAEDLTGQVFLKAVRSLDLMRDPLSTRNWLFQVARTTIADYWRVRYRGAASSLEDLLETGWEGPVDEEAPLVNSRAEERAQDILQALPERDREVLTCRFLLNLTIRETAARMGLSETNIKVMQYRALRRAADLEHIATDSISEHAKVIVCVQTLPASDSPGARRGTTDNTSGNGPSGRAGAIVTPPLPDVNGLTHTNC
jgi:RNA polymerase sigma-70 factor (ECF subfamily)